MDQHRVHPTSEGRRKGVLLGEDPTLARRLARLGGPDELSWTVGEPPQEPDLVVIDLAADGAVDRVHALRARWRDAIIAGYLCVPDPELWLAGQRAGCDVVSNRGALVARLRSLLAGGADASGHRFPLAAEADLAGRLGLVARVATTPVGPVAVYRADGRFCVVEDVCPHAGASLSEGELDGTVVTCPRHGSRFDVRTGERVRGPADVPVRTFRATVANGHLSMTIDRSGGG